MSGKAPHGRLWRSFTFPMGPWTPHRRLLGNLVCHRWQLHIWRRDDAITAVHALTEKGREGCGCAFTSRLFRCARSQRGEREGGGSYRKHHIWSPGVRAGDVSVCKGGRNSRGAASHFRLQLLVTGSKYTSLPGHEGRLLGQKRDFIAQ